ncbi:AAA family ATPase, partial [Pseudomonas sp. K8]|uniref:AAA family ATPase n=1 Tax=Pseudomonas sp. K8 TaxID=212200 RepID=UPI001867BD61
AMVSDAIGHPGASRRPSRRWVNATARRVVKRVEAERAVWQVWHLRAEAWRHARANDIAPDLMAKAVSRVVSRAVADHCEPLNDPDPLLQASTTPPALQRPGGVCVYVEHDSRLLTSRPVVEAERLLLRTAKRRGGATAPESVVHAAIARTRATDRPLNAPQAAFVHELSTSGRRLQLAIAPAGSGKPTALAVLSEAWRRPGGDVLGLAPSAVAAQQLRDAFTPASDTTGPAVVCETLSK